MTEQEAEEMIKALHKRISEKDQLLEDLKNENARLAGENAKLKDLAKRLARGWDSCRSRDWGDPKWEYSQWLYSEMVRDKDVLELFQ